MRYRKEIDGLRAIAVLAVIFFHAGFHPFEGGYVGVDVFFIISGYLITTIILADMEKGKFSILSFYERRARRILPALFFVMLCCLPLAWICLLPHHLKDFCKSLIAVSLFSSNIMFWTESGYFNTAAELKPLLHTWSLSVEEQYYVLFPMFLIALWKLKKRWIFQLLTVIAIFSLALAQWGAYHKPPATFFLLPTRAWELALGALIAFYFLYRREQAEFAAAHRIASEVLSSLGLAFICYSIFAFDKSTPFPSLYALIPTLGTALIIMFSTADTVIGRFLGSKPLVGIGLLSYSAYLWHQPLFAFARHISLTEAKVTSLIALSILSLMLAYFSWHYVEMPFRNKKTFSRRNVITFAAAGSLFLFIIGLAGYLNNGFTRRIPSDLNNSFNIASERSPTEKLCTSPNVSHAIDSYATPHNAGKYVYLIGDSHAGVLAGKLREGIERLRKSSGLDIGFMAFCKVACPPVVQVYREDIENDSCYSHNTDVYSFISSNERIEYVIMSARWTLNLISDRFDNCEGGIERGQPAKLDILDDKNKRLDEHHDRKDFIAQQYVKSVEYLLNMGKKVILIYPIPEAGWNVPDYLLRYCFYKRISAHNIPKDIGSTSYDIFIERNKETYAILDAIGEHPNLFRVYPEKIFCNTYSRRRCCVQNNGEIFYRDDDHLSLAGASLVVDQVTNILLSQLNNLHRCPEKTYAIQNP